MKMKIYAKKKNGSYLTTSDPKKLKRVVYLKAKNKRGWVFPVEFEVLYDKGVSNNMSCNDFSDLKWGVKAFVLEYL